MRPRPVGVTDLGSGGVNTSVEAIRWERPLLRSCWDSGPGSELGTGTCPESHRETGRPPLLKGTSFSIPDHSGSFHRCLGHLNQCLAKMPRCAGAFNPTRAQQGQYFTSRHHTMPLLAPLRTSRDDNDTTNSPWPTARGCDVLTQLHLVRPGRGPLRA